MTDTYYLNGRPIDVGSVEERGIFSVWVQMRVTEDDLRDGDVLPPDDLKRWLAFREEHTEIEPFSHGRCQLIATRVMDEYLDGQTDLAFQDYHPLYEAPIHWVRRMVRRLRDFQEKIRRENASDPSLLRPIKVEVIDLVNDYAEHATAVIWWDKARDPLESEMRALVPERGDSELRAVYHWTTDGVGWEFVCPSCSKTADVLSDDIYIPPSPSTQVPSIVCPHCDTAHHVANVRTAGNLYLADGKGRLTNG